MNPERLLQHFDRIAEAPDAIPRLRRFILDLAVRGKLVPQDPNDEPAAELLKRIQAEKAQLVKEGKIKKEKPIQSRAKGGMPAELPKGWFWTSIQEVCTSVTDGDHLPPSKSESGIPFLVIGNVRSQSIEFGGCRHVPDTYYQQLDEIRRPSKGDVLYTLVGSYGIPVVVRDARPFCVQRHIGILRPSQYEDVDFLVRALESKVVFDQATQCATGIAQKTVPLAGLRGILIPLPPLAEQHRIVAKVDELMALCDRLEAAKTEREQSRDRLVAASLHHLNQPADAEEDNTPDTFRDHARFIFNHLPRLTTRPEHLKQLRQTILNLAVRGKLVPQDPNDEPAAELLKRIQAEKARLVKEGKLREQKPLSLIAEENADFDPPYGWKWARMADVIKLWNGYAFKSSDFQSEGVPVIRIGDLQAGEVVLSSAVCVSDTVAKSVGPEVWIPPEALLIAMSGATTGKVAFNRTGSRLLLNQRVGRIEVFLISTQFIRFFFETIIARNLSISFGTAIPNLSAQQINETVIPLPPLAEQHRIVAKVDELMALCDQLEAQLTTTEADSRRLLEAVLHEALAPALEEAA